MSTRADTNNNWRQRGTNTSTNNTNNNMNNNKKYTDNSPNNRPNNRPDNRPNNTKKNARGPQNKAPVKSRNNRSEPPQVKKAEVPDLNEDNWPTLGGPIAQTTASTSATTQTWGGSSLIAKIKDEQNVETLVDDEPKPKEWLVLN